MSVALVQAVVLTADNITLTTTPTTVAFGGAVTAGSTVIVVVGTNASPAAITVDDLTNGTYTQAVYNEQVGVSGTISIWYKQNVSAFTNVRVATTSGSNSFSQVAIYEASGAATQAPTTGTFDTSGGGTTSHQCSSGISGTGISIAGIAANNDDTMAAASGYTLDSAVSSTQYIIQHKIGTMTSDTATGTTATGLLSTGAMAIFEEAAPVGTPFFTQIDSRYL